MMVARLGSTYRAARRNRAKRERRVWQGITCGRRLRIGHRPGRGFALRQKARIV